MENVEIVVRATLTNRCLVDGPEEERFGYREGDLGRMVWYWRRREEPPEFRVVWDHDEEKLLRRVLLHNLALVGLQQGNCRIMVAELPTRS